MRRPSVLFPFALLLGLVALARGLQVYNDRYTERLQRSATRPASPAAPPTKPEPPPASAAELARLADPDSVRRQMAASVLSRRAVTPELRQAVDLAFDNPANASLRSELACIKAHYPGDTGLAFALTYLPSRRDGYLESGGDRFSCVVEALADRATERPDAAYDVLYEAAMSERVGPREAALRGLRRLNSRPIPGEVRALCWYPAGGRERRDGIRMAMALGAIEQEPDIVSAALLDREMGSVVASELVEFAGPAAARLLVSAAIARQKEGREEPYLTSIVIQRESRWQDISAVLVETALDNSKSIADRQAALEIVARVGDPGAAPPLAALRASGEAVLRAYAEAAIAALDRRHAEGFPRRQLPRITP